MHPKATEVKLNPFYISVADICALGNTTYELLAQLLQWAGGNRESLALTCTRDWSGFVNKVLDRDGKQQTERLSNAPLNLNNAASSSNGQQRTQAAPLRTSSDGRVCVHRADAEGNDTIEIQLSYGELAGHLPRPWMAALSHIQDCGIIISQPVGFILCNCFLVFSSHKVAA